LYLPGFFNRAGFYFVVFGLSGNGIQIGFRAIKLQIRSIFLGGSPPQGLSEARRGDVVFRELIGLLIHREINFEGRID
jgi:hypothetical protein